jgi:uncharacterized membrane protein YhhN
LLIIVVAAYYFALLTILFPTLGDMKIPVTVYGLVISTMLLFALHVASIKNREAAKWLLTGAILFVISDSVLAINKFYYPFEYSGTYYAHVWHGSMVYSKRSDSISSQSG